MALDCWFVTGATASGKSAVGLELAQILNGEIISLDSMAIYRGMDIGTAKPSMADRQRIAHHMLDIADPVDEFTVSRYREMAIDVIRQIRDRGKEVIFVGGTALYLKALFRGDFRRTSCQLGVSHGDRSRTGVGGARRAVRQAGTGRSRHRIETASK